MTHTDLHMVEKYSQTIRLSNLKGLFRQCYDPHASSKKMREIYACIPKLASKAVSGAAAGAVNTVSVKVRGDQPGTTKERQADLGGMEVKKNKRSKGGNATHL